MAGLLEGIANVAGAPVRGLLDFRQTLINQRNDLLNPLVQRRQADLAREQQEAIRMALGNRGMMPPGMVQGPEGQTRLGEGGLLVDTGNVPKARGLLANETFAQDAPVLNFAEQLAGNPATAALGSAMMDSVMRQRMVLQANQQNANLKAQADATQAAIQREERNRDFARGLVNDARRALGPWVDQQPEAQALFNVLGSGSKADALASLYLFFQQLEPGGIVRDNETGMYRGVGGAFESIANQMNAFLGEGDSLPTRQALAQTVMRIIQPRIENALATRAQFEEQAAASDLGTAADDFRAGLPNVYAPQLPESLLAEPRGQGADDQAERDAAAEAQGLKRGKPDRINRRTRSGR